MNALEAANLTGAITAVALYASAILVFALRLLKRTRYVYWVGIFEFCLAIPLAALLATAPSLSRPALYFVQIGLMLAWLVLEFALDYVWKVDFRRVKWAVAGYVVLFFAGTGGMLGVCALAGDAWKLVSIPLFLLMATLAFVQRALTGH